MSEAIVIRADELTIKQLKDQLTEKDKEIEELHKELADYQFNYPKIKELEAQIEKMKCFKNCLTFGVFKCPAQSDKTITSCIGCKYWQLKE